MPRFVPGFAAVLIFCATAVADEVDALIGGWISPDGAVKSEYVRDFDGEWVTTRMWFNSGDAWKLVSQGAMYRRPGDGNWIGISRTRDMGQIVLFESVFEFSGDGRVKLTNTAYNADGSTLASEEDWQLSGDSISYDIFEIVAGERKPLMTGEWRKIKHSKTKD